MYFSILEFFIEILQLWLKEGHSVRPGNPGMILISFKCTEHEAEEYAGARGLKNAGAVFYKSNEFKNERTGIYFEKLKEAASLAGSEHAAGSSSG